MAGVLENWLFRSLQSFRFWRRTLFSVSSTLCSELQAHYDSADYMYTLLLITGAEVYT